MEASMIDPLFGLTARIFLGLFFLFAALHKARDRQAFVAALGGYALLPGPLLRPAALMLLASEILVGALLVLPGTLAPGMTMIASLAAAALLALYFAAIAANLLRGRRHIDCGCSFGSKTSMLSGWHLVRIASLMALALLPLAGTSSRILGGFDMLNLGGAVIALAVLYAAADTLLVNHGQMNGQVRERVIANA